MRSRPIVRSDGDRVYVSFDGARSWLVLDAAGNLDTQFRGPPMKANTVWGGKCCNHPCRANW